MIQFICKTTVPIKILPVTLKITEIVLVHKVNTLDIGKESTKNATISIK